MAHAGLYAVYFVIFQANVNTVTCCKAVAVCVALIGSRLVLWIENLGCASSSNFLIQEVCRAYGGNSIDILFVPNKSLWTVPSGKAQGKCLHFIYTEEFFLTNVPDLSQHLSVFLSLCGFFICFISVLIKLNLNNASLFYFHTHDAPDSKGTEGQWEPSIQQLHLDCYSCFWLAKDSLYSPFTREGHAGSFHYGPSVT